MTQRSQLPHHLRRFGFAGLFAVGLVGCRHNQAQSAAQNPDPAAANMAQPYTGGNAGGYGNGSAQVLGQSQAYTGQATTESYETQAPAPIIRRAPAGAANAAQDTTYYPVPQAQTTQAQYSQAPQGYADASQGYPSDPNAQPYNGPYDDAEQAGEDAVVDADQAPPPLPEYDQPPAPADDYEWTPGYWNYASAGYYWVPGAWVAPPFYGALWTPPYWGYAGNRWRLHHGYWGSHVGYYGGINYGFGYIGIGYFGGYWNDRHFFYNRAVTNVNITNVHNVYNHTVIYNNITYGPHSNDRISYNGGRGGINAQPRPQEIAAMRETHFAATGVQREHREAAAGNRGQFFTQNQGRPAQAFAGRPVGSLGNVGAPPRAFADARGTQPNGANTQNRFGNPAGAPAGNNGFNRPGFDGAGNNRNPGGLAPQGADSRRAAENTANPGRFDSRNPGQGGFTTTPNGAMPQPGNMHRVAPAGTPGSTDRFNQPLNQGAPTNPERNQGRPADRYGAAQPGLTQPAGRTDTNPRLPTPEAPRTQINNSTAGGNFNRPQAIQQRQQQTYPAQRTQPQQASPYGNRQDLQQQRGQFAQQIQRQQQQQQPTQVQQPAQVQQRPQTMQQQQPFQQRPQFTQRPEAQPTQPRQQTQPQPQSRPEPAAPQRTQPAPRAEAPRSAAAPRDNAPHNH